MTPPKHSFRLPADRSRSVVAALAHCSAEPVRSLVVELGAADPALLQHGGRVAARAAAVAQRLGLPPDRLETLRRSAILHDTGKRFVAREILDKPAALLVHERMLVEAHSVTGANVLLAAGLITEATVVRHHHERWDGHGYPDRLSGETIPLESRIVLVADAYDAMTSERPYRATLSPAAALAELERGAGSQFDLNVVEAFADALAVGSAA